LLDNGLSWNEQYFLQAFLMDNERYRLRLSISALMFDRGDSMTSLLPSSEIVGGSVWLEKVA
jgi:hypothetical protein